MNEKTLLDETIWNVQTFLKEAKWLAKCFMIHKCMGFSVIRVSDKMNSF